MDMLISVPLTGRVISYHPLKGDPNDPVRPIDIEFGMTYAEAISFDFENDLVLMKITPTDLVKEEKSQLTGKLDEDGHPIYRKKKRTEQGKQAILNNIKAQIQDKSLDELYRVSKCARLKKPMLKKPKKKE